MNIGGFQKLSFIDYPETIASVVYTQGCNWRCPWCHNPALVYPDRFDEPMVESDIFDFFQKRRNEIEGVVITGGEPTLQKDLICFIKKCRLFDLKVKLDTNGSHPDVLESILSEELVDYVAMDVKGAFGKYECFTGIKCREQAFLKSIALLNQSGVEYEVRTTLLPHLHDLEDVLTMAKESIGHAKRFAIQRYRNRDQPLTSLLEEKMDLLTQAFLDLKETELSQTVVEVRH